MTKPYENAGVYEPPPGWTHVLRRHAYHQCGWSTVHRLDDAGTHRAEVEAHARLCCWPEMPEPVETPDG